jgi:hypothetical protein
MPPPLEGTAAWNAYRQVRSRACAAMIARHDSRIQRLPCVKVLNFAG